MARKRVTAAREALKSLHWRNETTFKFETYVTRLKSAIQTLEKYDPPGPTPSSRVDFLIGGINNNDVDIRATIRHIRCNPAKCEDFDSAAGDLAQTISEVYPDATSGRKRSSRHISDVQRDSRPHRNGRGPTRGGSSRTGHPQKYKKNPSRIYQDSATEWTCLTLSGI